MSNFKAMKAVLLGILLIYSTSNAQWTLDTVITAGTNTSGIAITSDGSKLVVTNNTDPGEIRIISASDFSISTIDISSIENYPNSVTIAPNDSVAIINTMHKTIFINLYSNAVLGSVSAPCAGTTLYGIAVTPNNQTAVFPDLSSDCTQQGVRLLDASGKSSQSTFIPVNTSGELYGIALTPDGSSAVLTTFSSDFPKKVNMQTSEVQNITGITSGSYGIAMLHNANEAIIYDGDSLDLVSLNTNSLIKKIAGLSYNTNFQNIAVTGNDKYAFAVGAFEKLVISLTADTVVQTFSSGGTNVASNSDGSTFYVTDSYNGTVRVYKNQTVSGVDVAGNQSPSGFVLQQNYPNPFNPSTTIGYTIPDGSFVTLKIFDILGREIFSLINKYQTKGNYNLDFNASKLQSGIYFYQLKAGKYIAVKKMLVLK